MVATLTCELSIRPVLVIRAVWFMAMFLGLRDGCAEEGLAGGRPPAWIIYCGGTVGMIELDASPMAAAGDPISPVPLLAAFMYMAFRAPLF